MMRTGRPERIDDYAGFAAPRRDDPSGRDRVGGHGADHRRRPALGGARGRQRRDVRISAPHRAADRGFAELVADALANTGARGPLQRLPTSKRRCDGSRCLSRAAPPTEVFERVTEEVGRLLGARTAGMIRYEGEDKARVVGGSGPPGPVAPPHSTPGASGALADRGG